MVNIEAVRNWPYRPGVGEAMRMDKATLDIELAVTARVASACPEPMIVSLLDLLPESFLRLATTTGGVPTADSAAMLVAPTRCWTVIPNAIDTEGLTAPLADKVERHRGEVSRGEVAPFGLNHRAGSRALLYEWGRRMRCI